jgi:hypothetical protein
MPDPGISDWQAQGVHARETAEGMVNPAAIRIMLELAKYYDVLASEARDDVASSRPANGMILNTG